MRRCSKTEETLKDKNIRKSLGCSSAVELGCVRHTFGIADESQPFKEQIFDTLEGLGNIMED